MDNGRYTIVGIAAATILAAVTWIFHAANYRSNVYGKWPRQRIGGIIAGLDERAANAIYELLKIIQSDYGYISSEEFWPQGPLPDPDEYKPYIRKYSKALKYKDRIQADVDRLLFLGYVIVIDLTILVIGATLVVLHFSIDINTNTIVHSGYALSSLSLLIATVILFLHVFLNNRLTNAEMLSEEEFGDA